jgi:Domain of unknown function (DUF5069)
MRLGLAKDATRLDFRMTANLSHAPNLTQRPPRSPQVRLGGYVLLARILDKGRADLAGTAGEYKYNNPMDHHWFRFTGITAEALKAQIETGKGDGEILAWIEENAPLKRTPWEIHQWSAYHSERGPDSDVETLLFFTKGVGKLSKTREDVKTWFDYLDLDDHVTFGGQA